MDKEKNVSGGMCGSCGRQVGGITRKKRIEQDQDKGYGICSKCEQAIVEQENEMLDKWAEKVKETLNVENRKEFLKLDKEIQRVFILQCIEDGIIKVTGSTNNKNE